MQMARPFITKGAKYLSKHIVGEALDDYGRTKVQEATGIKVSSPPPTTAMGFAALLGYTAGKQYLSQNQTYLRGKLTQIQNGPSTSPQIDQFVAGQEHAAFRFGSDFS